ncbi:hypothetical protein ACNITT_27070, partial [Escherichia coli]
NGSHAVGRWSYTVGVAAMGVCGYPQTLSGRAQGAAGPVAARFFLENGEQNHARDFEAAKEQCRIDTHGQNVNT